MFMLEQYYKKRVYKVRYIRPLSHSKSVFIAKIVCVANIFNGLIIVIKFLWSSALSISYLSFFNFALPNFLLGLWDEFF